MRACGGLFQNSFPALQSAACVCVRVRACACGRPCVRGDVSAALLPALRSLRCGGSSVLAPWCDVLEASRAVSPQVGSALFRLEKARGSRASGQTREAPPAEPFRSLGSGPSRKWPGRLGLCTRAVLRSDCRRRAAGRRARLPGSGSLLQASPGASPPFSPSTVTCNVAPPSPGLCCFQTSVRLCDVDSAEDPGGPIALAHPWSSRHLALSNRLQFLKPPLSLTGHLQILIFLSRTIFPALRLLRIQPSTCGPDAPSFKFFLHRDRAGYLCTLLLVQCLASNPEPESQREKERQRHRQREKQAPCREPDVGFDPGSPGSRPGSKAGAKPLCHPGIPGSQRQKM
ncbi:uncharacterized protein [Canis lupus baileyi]|uniref:uncharacterized protein n=1 Tax=Canis lupus baileyi TaxID=143281 RepID=UPI003B97AC22